MVFKNYRTNIIIRVILLAVTFFLFFFVINNKLYLTSAMILIAAGIQIYAMIRYMDKINRELASFLESIRFSDFTRSYEIKGFGAQFSEVYKAFNEVIDDFQKVRAEKEEHYQYLQSIVRNIDVSVIAYLPDGKIEMINTAAKKLFRQGSIQNINKLSTLSPELVETLLHIKPGEIRIVKVQDEDDLMQLAISASDFKIKNKVIILATIKNIQDVLDNQETEAWQKLIRVLTHEIMNSVTPISSLSATLDSMLKEHISGKGEEAAMDKETLNEAIQAIQTINKRSTGLLHFVNTYRNLTRIPKPDFRIIPLESVFKSISHLMENELIKKGIRLEIEVEPPSLELSLDEKLIEQVLINLIQNSIKALEETSDPVIKIRGFISRRGRPTIQVIDNGMGILKEVLDKIFIPFFTTRPSGSGIGLSLSRQILRLHGGTITAKSEPDKETTFTMTF